MKYVKYTLAVLAILFLVYIAIGILKPEITYDSEIVVDKPVGEAWAVIQDEDKLKEWLPGIQKVEPVSGDPGTVGAVSDIYFDSDGQKMTIRETITALKPGESIAMTYTSDFMNMDYQLRASPVDNGKTQLSSHSIVTGNGMFSKSMLAVMSGTLKQQEETNLRNLKKAIEQNTKNYSLDKQVDTLR